MTNDKFIRCINLNNNKVKFLAPVIVQNKAMMRKINCIIADERYDADGNPAKEIEMPVVSFVPAKQDVVVPEVISENETFPTEIKTEEVKTVAPKGKPGRKPNAKPKK